MNTLVSMTIRGPIAVSYTIPARESTAAGPLRMPNVLVRQERPLPFKLELIVQTPTSEISVNVQESAPTSVLPEHARDDSHHHRYRNNHTDKTE